MSSTAALAGVTEETLSTLSEPMKKALSTGYTVGMGLQGYELEAPAKFLVPVLSPWRNRVPRNKAVVGSQLAHWKAITGINVGKANPSIAWGNPGAVVQTNEVDYAAAYAPLALGDTVQMDAQMLARGFDDLRARAGTNLLYALMIAEDIALLGNQNFALQTPAAPTVTTATTGGSIGATTAVHFRVTARTIENYFYGGGTVPSADGTATTGAGTTNTASATVAAVAGAVAYDWYAGASTTAYFYVGTTTTNVSPTLTSMPAADAAATTLANCAAARAGAGGNIAATFTDSSADANAFNGLLASCAGDIGTNGVPVQRGTGTSSGAIFKSLDGATLTGSNGTIAEIDAQLLAIYNASRISPTRMLMSAQTHFDVSNKMVATGALNTFLQGEDMRFRQAATGGIFMTKYVNKAFNGFPIEMETMPNLPQGLIVMVTEVLPYPNNEVSSVFEVETQQEYQQLEYAMSRGTGSTGGPRYDVEVRAIEAFKNYFPAGCVVISNIQNG